MKKILLGLIIVMSALGLLSIKMGKPQWILHSAKTIVIGADAHGLPIIMRMNTKTGKSDMLILIPDESATFWRAIEPKDPRIKED